MRILILLVLLAAVVTWSAQSLADTVQMKDGRKLEGRILIDSGDRIVFETTDPGGKVAKSTILKVDVDRIVKGALPTSKPALPVTPQALASVASRPATLPASRPANAPRILTTDVRAEVAAMGKIALDDLRRDKWHDMLDLDARRVGVILAMAGDFDGAGAAVQKAGAQWGPRATGWLAAMERVAGDPRGNDAALARLKQKLIVFPEFEEALAEAFASVGELTLARQVVREAQLRDPALFGPHMLLAVIRRDPHREDYDAIATIWKTYHGKPSDIAVELAEAQALVGDFDGARAAIAAVKDGRERNNATARFVRAQAIAGDLEGAQKTAASIPADDGMLESEQAYIAIAASMALKGDADGAGKMLSHVKSTTRPVTEAVVAYALTKAGDDAGARAFVAQLAGNPQRHDAAAFGYGMRAAAFIDRADTAHALEAIQAGRKLVEGMPAGNGRADAARLLIKSTVLGPRAADTEGPIAMSRHE